MQFHINNVPVSKDDYDTHLQNRKKRNKIIVLVVSTIIVGIFGFYFGVIALVKNSDAYRKAEEEIFKNKQVLDITSGIRSISFGNGSVEIEGEKGDAEFFIEVEGVKKDIDVYIHLKKNKKGWEADIIDIDNT